MDKNKLIKTFLIWIVLFFVFTFIMQSCQKGKGDEAALEASEIGLQTTKNEYAQNKEVILTIKNNLKEELKFPKECPEEPFNVYRITSEGKEQISASPKINCAQEKEIIIPANSEYEVSYNYWLHGVFGEVGRYKIELTTNINGEDKTFSSNEFAIEEASFLTYLWRTLLYQPIYNVLIFFTSILPGSSLGFAIILLTILIRLILLLPSQKGLRAQRKMQEIQPRLDSIKEKYKGNQEQIAKETMAVWKEYKINPLSSCLPILLQIPILIALFYVIKDGLNPDMTYLLYPQLKDFAIESIDVMFLNILNLTERNIYVLPLIVGGLQFLQMKLTSYKIKKKQHPEKQNEKKPDMKIATEMMTYVLPVMIAIFTTSVPAGVGLYWGTSTIFGIIQQIFVNREKPSSMKHENKFGKEIIDQEKK